MKRILAILGLLSSSVMAFALGCEHLGITVTNTSPHDCVLKATQLFYGSLYRGGVPAVIPSGTTSPVFYFLQDDIGVGVRLDYRCDNKVVIFYSGQNSCSLGAGDIGGFPYIGNDLPVDHRETMGSWWYGLPGHISWKIG